MISYFLAYVFVLGLSEAAYQELLRVDKGTSISFFDLWDLKGYKTGQSGSSIHRSGYIDNAFTPNCPSIILVGFRNSDKRHFYLSVPQPFINSSINEWIKSATEAFNLDQILPSFSLEVSPQKEVIMKVFKSGEIMPNLYLAVHFPTHTTGYPRYYVAKTAPQPSFGSIPGDEDLFNSTEYMRVVGLYHDSCILSDTGQLKTDNEIKTMIKNVNKLKNCNSFNKQGTYYKQSNYGHPTITNATTLWKLTVDNRVMCALKCSEDRCNCESFFFTVDTGDCIGLSHVEDVMDKPQTAIHYVQDTNTRD